MRKILSLVLALSLALSLAVPAFSASAPSVSARITGNGNNARLEITVGNITESGLSWSNNSTKVYEVGDFSVEVQIQGNSVRSVRLVAPAQLQEPGNSLVLTPTVSARTNSSGDKISSNSHSANFAGLYFGWDEKQKDPGVLYVNESVFNLFKDGQFLLTAQNANRYWDYLIQPLDLHRIEGGITIAGREFHYEYRIPKVAQSGSLRDELKNINQVFIGGNYKDATVIVEKEWIMLDEDGEGDDSLVEFTNGFKLGENAIKISTFGGRSISFEEKPIDGFKLVRVTINGEGVPARVNSITGEVTFPFNFNVRATDVVTVEFTNEEEELDFKGELSINKTVDGQFFADWALSIENSINIDMKELLEGIVFKAYSVTGKGAAFDRDNPVAVGELIPSGQITFSPSSLPLGWYAIVEEFTNELAERIFHEVAPLYVYLGENGVEGSQTITISSQEGLTENMVAVDGAFQMPGQSQSILDQWSDLLRSAFDSMDPDLGEAVWVWDVPNPSAVYGIDGSVVRFDIPFDIYGEIMDDEVMFAFAADNAAVVYVNDNLAGYTSRSMRWEYDNQIKDESAFGDLLFADFDGSAWFYSYEYDIKPYLIDGPNIITVFAANSASTGYYDESGVFVPGATGTINDTYNYTNNPSGLIFNCVFTVEGAVFDNMAKPRPLNEEIALEKKVDGDALAIWLLDKALEIEELIESFELYKVENENDELVGDPIATFDVTDEFLGYISFIFESDGDLEGWYAVKEVLTDYGKEVFEDVGILYFYVDEDGDIGDEVAFDNKEKKEIEWEWVQVWIRGAYDYEVDWNKVNAPIYNWLNPNAHLRANPANSFGEPNALNGVSQGDEKMTSIGFFKEGVTFRFGEEDDFDDEGKPVYQDVFRQLYDRSIPDLTLTEVTWTDGWHHEAVDLYLVNVEFNEGADSLFKELHYVGRVYNRVYGNGYEANGFRFAHWRDDNFWHTNVWFPDEIFKAEGVRLVDVTNNVNAPNGTGTLNSWHQNDDGYDLDAMSVWYRRPKVAAHADIDAVASSDVNFNYVGSEPGTEYDSGENLVDLEEDEAELEKDEDVVDLKDDDIYFKEEDEDAETEE